MPRNLGGAVHHQAISDDLGVDHVRLEGSALDLGGFVLSFDDDVGLGEAGDDVADAAAHLSGQVAPPVLRAELAKGIDLSPSARVFLDYNTRLLAGVVDNYRPGDG